jgi:hypothetical protein
MQPARHMRQARSLPHQDACSILVTFVTGNGNLFSCIVSLLGVEVVSTRTMRSEREERPHENCISPAILRF